MLPRGDQYFLAIQNPGLAFADADLKVCTAEKNPMGLPKPYSGGFTTTYHLHNHNRHWAARCFTREIPDLKKRYREIGRFLAQNASGCFVGAEYLEDGIRVAGHWYPIVKMPWVRGVPLNTYVQMNLSHPSRLGSLPEKFAAVVRELQRLNIAHGDLQHGNIIVQNGNLHLVDYDGMFVPKLSGLTANELGHINYQHPARTDADFDETLDRFSSVVIYLGLRAVALKPQLWQRYDNSENLLFRRDDFLDLDSSQLIAELESLSQLSTLIGRFRVLCHLELDEMPTLDQFITGEIRRKPDARGAPAYRLRSQYRVIDAKDTRALGQSIGSKVEVIGRITDFHLGTTRHGERPYMFLNFGSYPKQTLTLVLWSKALEAFEDASADPLKYVGKHVRTVGVLGQYRNRPQIEISQPSQIQILPEEDAVIQASAKPSPSKAQRPVDRAAGARARAERAPAVSQRAVGGKKKARDVDTESLVVLNRLYGGDVTGKQTSRPRQGAPGPATPPTKPAAVRGSRSRLRWVVVSVVLLTLAAVGLGAAGVARLWIERPGILETSAPVPAATATETATRTVEPSPTVRPSPTVAPSPQPPPWREDTAAPQPTVDVSECMLGALFQADLTVPDGTLVEAGEVFTKTWLIRNTGTCTWADGFQLHFVDGDQMGETSPIPVPLTSEGEESAVSVRLTAPAEPGRYRGRWQICVNQTECFGDKVFVEIVVPE